MWHPGGLFMEQWVKKWYSESYMSSPTNWGLTEATLQWHPILLSPACMLSRSDVSDSLWPPWTVARQAPLSMEFFRQEYRSELPFPTAGDLPDPEIEPVSLASPAWQVDSLPLSHLGILWAPWKTKQILCDLPDCDIHFIAVVWNRTHSISEVCLYIKATILARKCLAGWTGHRSFL